jgi:endonuclease/exonuclease/phosphatase family metal-dependent hydrolase
MLKRLLIFALLSISISSIAYGQLFEDFEENQKAGYASGIVSQQTGNWFLGDALIRSDGSGDLKNGNQSVRIRDGLLQMNFDYSDGATELSFLAGNSSFSGDGGGKVQAFISTDSGSNWTEIGDEFTLTDTFESYAIPLDQTGPVRFRIDKTAGGRINIDDFRIEPFVELDATPTIVVRRNNQQINNSEFIAFPAAAVDASRSIDIDISNNGEPDLDISSVDLSDGSAFSIDSDIIGSLASRESSTLTLTFTPPVVDDFTDQLTISTNDPEIPDFVLNLSGSAISVDDITPIAEARELEFGTRVTVSGRVTVANEFTGPSFLQDETAGIAVFWNPFHEAVQRGDSVIITGPVTEFNPIGGTPGTFLFQIAEYQGDDDITFEVIDTESIEVEPQVISLAEMNSGNYESQLITVSGVSFDESGAFQGGTNYPISDFSGSAELRIDQNASDLVNALIPEEPLEITGVVEEFNGVSQLKPRDSQDLEIEVFEPVGDDIPKDQTFDVVTWNVEWFGSGGNGPDDTDLQLTNVITVVETIDADLYALQEISSETQFLALVDSLDEYSGFWADYSSQTQNTAYLYKSSVINSVNSGLLEAGQQEFDWAFRLPLFFEFDATVEGITRRIHAYNVHAKALADQESYERRVLASLRMKVYLDNNRQDDNVIFLGDYNDQLFTSTFNNEVSPYDNFVEDDTYFKVTASLEQRGLNSYIAGQNQSMIDHITVTNELVEDHIEGAQRVENPSYIGSYISTTSDHAPVWTRFDFSRSLVSIDDPLSESPRSFELNQNYPNPFNPNTNISFTLPERADVSLKVYDVMGRQVATLANNRSFTGGTHTLSFDASTLASGMYIYRLTMDNGMTLSRKMMIVK